MGTGLCWARSGRRWPAGAGWWNLPIREGPTGALTTTRGRCWLNSPVTARPKDGFWENRFRHKSPGRWREFAGGRPELTRTRARVLLEMMASLGFVRAASFWWV